MTTRRMARIRAVALTVGLALACGGEQTPAPTAGEGAGASAAIVEIPDDLPRYPAATIVEFDNESYEDGVMASFESSDPMEQIRAFFDRELPAQGWEIEVAKRLGDAYILFANKDKIEVNIDITEGEPTTIEVSVYAYEPE